MVAGPASRKATSGPTGHFVKTSRVRPRASATAPALAAAEAAEAAAGRPCLPEPSSRPDKPSVEAEAAAEVAGMARRPRLAIHPGTFASVEALSRRPKAQQSLRLEAQSFSYQSLSAQLRHSQRNRSGDVPTAVRT